MIRRTLAIFSLICLSLFATPQLASAFDTYGGIDCGANGAGKSAVCTDSKDPQKDPLTGTDGILLRIADIVAFVAGAAAIIIIIVSAIRFITAGGDSSKVATARGSLINALIGLVVIVLARSLVVYIVNRV